MKTKLNELLEFPTPFTYKVINIRASLIQRATVWNN